MPKRRRNAVDNDTNRGRPSWPWSLSSIEKIVGIVVALVGLPAAVVAAYGVFSGGDASSAGGRATPVSHSTPAPSAPPTVIIESSSHKQSDAAAVRACEQAHDMERASDQRRAGAEDAYNPTLKVTTELFRRCDWPPPPGADKDGYTEVRVEHWYNTTRAEFENPHEDVWRSSCRRYRLDYLLMSKGVNQPRRLVISAGTRHFTDGQSAHRIAYLAHPAPTEAVVRRSGGEVPQAFHCLAD